MYGLALTLAAAVLFGASTPASKLLLQELTPLQLAGLLYLGAGLGVAPGVLRERRLEPRRSLDRANRRRLAGAVVCGGLLGPVLLLLGLTLATAGSVSLLLNLELVATALLGIALFREPLGRRGALGVAGAMAAGALLAGWGGWPGVASGLLVASACACWGLDNHLTALVDAMSPSRIALIKGAAAGATNLALGLALAPLRASAPAIGAALAVGALAYGASVALYIGGARQLGATRAQGVFATAPFLGAAFAFGLLGEPLSPVHWVAGGLLALSVVLLLTDRHAHEHAHDALEHTHSHRHDDGHHDHVHPGLPAWTRHTHWHRHGRAVHSHPHAPDLHHRHEH